MKISTKNIFKIFFIIFTLSLFLFFYARHYQNPRFAIFDVGQGDAIFFRTEDGEDILIDGGPDKTILNKLAESMPFWDRDLELVVLTHPHSDHLHGLIEAFKRYEVKKILLTGVRYDDPAYSYFLDLVRKEGSEIIYPESNDYLEFAGLQMQILFPQENLQNIGVKNINNSSVVILASFLDKKILLTGDSEEEVEEGLASLYDLSGLKVDILKAGHHGSKTSSSEIFISELSPELAVISCGEGNRFGHPSLRTISRFQRAKTDTWRTDLLGDFVLFPGL